MTRIAIVGAGVAGLAAAWTLRAAPAEVVLFEKSRGVSGRAATRGRRGVRYDHGANYFKLDPGSQAEALVRQVLPTDALATIAPGIWTFGASGQVQPGGEAANAETRWTYRDGISRLGKLLAEAVPAAVRLRTRIDHLEQTPDGWHLVTSEGARQGPFDRVLCTPPAPQTLGLLAEGTVDPVLQDAMEAALTPATYHTQFALVYAFEAPVPRPADFYALLNTDGEHAVAWLGFEEDKPGHVPDGQSVIVQQMSPSWSTSQYEADTETLRAEGLRHARALLQTELAPPSWFDSQRWRYALPEAAVDEQPLEQGRAAGLYVAGDACVGRGRVGEALENGLRVGAALRAGLA